MFSTIITSTSIITSIMTSIITFISSYTLLQRRAHLHLPLCHVYAAVSRARVPPYAPR
jgi:hypothetical protein